MSGILFGVMIMISGLLLVLVLIFALTKLKFIYEGLEDIVRSIFGSRK